MILNSSVGSQFSFSSLTGSKYIGIGCSCDPVHTVLCAFVFTSSYIGNPITDSAPSYLPYTLPGSCPAEATTANTFIASTCTGT